MPRDPRAGLPPVFGGAPFGSSQPGPFTPPPGMGPSGGGYSAPHVQPSAARVRLFPMSFSAKGLKPGERRRIVQHPQAPFRGEELRIPQEFSDATVHEIMVGNRLQGGGGDMSAKFFTPGAKKLPLSLDTANVAQDVALEVSRPNGGDFDALLVGPMMDDGSMPPTPDFDETEPLVEEAVLAIREEEERYEPGITLEELEALGWVR